MFTIKFGITLLYSIPSMIMYLLTVLMVRKHWKEFSMTFSKLYIVFFVFNNITFFNSFITVRIPQNTCGNCTMSFLFKAHTRENLSWFPLNVFSFVHYMMAYIQFSMIFLTSLNRFTMIFWIRSYEEVWNRFFILIIVLTIVIPVPLTLHILTNTTYYTYTETLDCFIVGSTVDRTSAYTRLLAFFGTVTFITAIINFASFCKLACMPNNVTVAERNLVFVSGSLFLVQFAAVLNTTVNRIFVNDSNKNTAWAQVAATLLPYVSDGLTLIHPWMFLAFSRTARRCFRIMYIPGASSVIPVRQVSGTNRSNVETHKF